MSNGKLKYPDEVYEFIKENFEEYGATLLPILNKKFGINMSVKYLSSCAYDKFGLKSNYGKEFNYTKEEEDWIKQNAYKYKSLNKLVEDFNSTFPRIKRSRNSMSGKLRRLSITLWRVDEKEIKWLKENAPFHTSKELAEMHNILFDKQRTWRSIQSIASHNNIKILSDSNARYDYFQKTSRSVKELGSTHGNSIGEYIKVDKSDSLKRLDYKQTWVRKNRYEYERQYGVKPKKWECVIHLDGDKTNYAKENLYLVPNYINGYILQHLGKLIKDQPELNKAHILRFEVEKAIKDYEKGNKNFREWRKSMDEYDPENEGVKE